jgi:hypothetical protein
MEILPPPPGGYVKSIPLLVATEGVNLYPAMFVLPSGKIFIFANKKAQLLDPVTFDTTLTLPDIPDDGHRSFPLTGATVLLPLKPENNYTAEVLVCGGQQKFNATYPAMDTCARINPKSGATWVMETMPIRRVMPDIVNLPDGTFLILNGCEQGYAGFDSCNMPAITALLYTPTAPLNSRFTVLNSTKIARLYHSAATLLPDGRVLIVGSTPNPNANIPNNALPYPNEARFEVYHPPYLTSGLAAPTISSLPNTTWDYGKTYELTAIIPSGNADNIKVVLVTEPFVTHSTHMGQRHITLVTDVTKDGTTFSIQVTSPPNANVGTPGWYMIWVLDGPRPCSTAKWIWLGGDVANVAAWPGF